MSAPSARALLREIDRLPAPERTRRLARLARDEVATSGLEVLCADLTAGDPFARYLALQLATVDGATEIVAQLLDDPDPAVAGAAVAASARMPVLYDLLLVRLPTLSRLQRRGLVRAVRRHVLCTLAERLLDPVRKHFGDGEGAALLSGCTTWTVEERLSELAYAVRNWAGLARHHPDAVVGHLRAELARTSAARHQEVWSRAGSAVTALATLRPHALLDLMEASAPDVVFPSLEQVLAPLARVDRDRTLRLLRDPHRPGRARGGRPFWRTLHDAPDADVVALARGLGPGALPRFLTALPPRQRPAVAAGLADGGELPTPVLFDVLDLLPATARHAEAARLLARPEVADDPDRRLRAVARLPWAQAREQLWAATRRPDADDRAGAYAQLLTAAILARDPDVLGEVLGDLRRLRNEQDPVRSAALAALRRVPSWQLRSAQLPAWTQVCLDAAGARDVSSASLDAVSAIAGALLREGAVRGDAAMTAAAVTIVGALGHQRTVDVRAATRSCRAGPRRRWSTPSCPGSRPTLRTTGSTPRCA